MGRRTRECYLCGEKYNYCPTCTQDKMKPTWMKEFHEINCKDIFNICTNFNLEVMSKDEARDALNKCDLSNKDNFKSFIQNDISNIFKDDAAPKVKKSKKAEPKTDIESHEVVNKEEE